MSQKFKTNISVDGTVTATSFIGSASDPTKLPLTGGTLTGQLIVGSASSAGSPTLRVNTQTSSGFVHIQESIAANLTTGQHVINVIGKETNAKNSGYIGYYWAANASDSNFVTIGHWGADDLFRVYGNGNVTISGTLSASGYNKSNWDTAYSWGNHASAGYLTAETDTLDSVLTRGATTDLGFVIENGNSTYSIPSTTNVPRIYMHNTGASATAHSILSLRTLGGTGGDPFVSFDLNGVTGWSVGADNSDSDKFKISNSWAALDSNTRFTIQTTGEIGIGTTTPSEKLQVAGNAYISGVGNSLYFDTFDDAKSVWQTITNNYEFHILNRRGNGSRFVLGNSDISLGTLYSKQFYINTTTGNVGIGKTTGVDYKLDVDGAARVSGLINTNNHFEKLLDTGFPNGQANLAVDIRFGNVGFWGYIEVEITGSYANQNTPGKLTKVYAVGVNPGNYIYTNESRVVDTLGAIPSNISLGEFEWDGAQSLYRIPISHIVSSGNAYTVKVKAFSHESIAINAFNNLSISPTYNRTAFARNYVHYNDRVGIGTTSPSTALHVLGSEEGIYVGRIAGAVSYGGHVRIQKARGSVAAPAIVANGDTLGTLTFEPYNGTGYTEQVGIRAIVSGGVGANSIPTDLFFAAGSSGTTSANERMRLKSNGSFGIGVNPAHTFHVDMTKGSANVFFQSGANDEEIFYGKSLASADCGVFRWRSSGLSIHSYGQSYGSQLFIDADTNRVGIGTTSPEYKLDVISNIMAANFTSGAGGYTSVRFSSSNGGAVGSLTTYQNKIYLGSENAGGTGSNAEILIEPNAGNILYLKQGGNVGIGTISPQDLLNIHNSSANANIGLKITRGGQTHGLRLGVNDSHAFLWTTEAQDLAFATSNIQRLTIRSGGNVGIGETSPTRKLHVKSDDDTRGILIEQTQASSYAELHLTANRQFRIGTGGSTSDADAQNRFYVYDATASAHRFTIDSSGFVGIGDASPSYKLDVSGDARATNNLISDYRLMLPNMTIGYWDSTYNRIESGSLRPLFITAYGQPIYMGRSGSIGDFTLNTSGQFGLGSTSMYHSAKLSVAGKVHFQPSSNTDIGGAIYSTWTQGANSSDYYAGDLRFQNFDASSGTYALRDRMIIDGKGYVGIGTMAPEYIFDVSRDSTRFAFSTVSGVATFHMDGANGDLAGGDYTSLTSDGSGNFSITTGNSERFRIKQDGNIGIGETNPLTKLSVRRFETTNRTLYSDIVTIDAAANNAPYSGHGGGILFRGETYSGSSNNSAGNRLWGRIGMYLNDSYDNFRGESMFFQVAQDDRSDTLTTAMTIHYNTYVGIGTNIPAHKLSVQGEIAKYTTTGIDGVFDSILRYGYFADLQAGATNTNRHHLIDASLTAGAGGSNKIRFKVYRGNLAQDQPPATVMTLTGDERVGIGTETPATKLHVLGNAVDDIGLVRIENTQNAGGIMYPAMQVINDRGNHSYGTVAEFRIASTGDGDRPSIMFSKGGTGNNWSVGMGVYTGASDSFTIGHRSTYYQDSWATAVITATTGGYVGIGDSTPDYKLDVNGTIRATGDVYAYSDARVKENIETIDNALDKVMSMRGVSYNRTDDDDKTKKVGVIAQEIREVLPEVVSEQADGMLSVSYGNIVGVLIEAIKEQQKQIDELKSLLNGSTK